MLDKTHHALVLQEHLDNDDPVFERKKDEIKEGHDGKFGPDSVQITVKVKAVRDIDPAANTFFAEFVVMLDWIDKALYDWVQEQGNKRSPTDWPELKEAWYPQIYVENALDELQVVGSEKQEEEGPRLGKKEFPGALKLTRLYRGVLRSNFELHKFPFDYHFLVIQFKARSISTTAQLEKLKAYHCDLTALQNDRKFVTLENCRMEKQLRTEGHTVDFDADELPEWFILSCPDQDQAKQEYRNKGHNYKAQKKPSIWELELEPERCKSEPAKDRYSVCVLVGRDPFHLCVNVILTLFSISLFSLVVFFFEVQELEQRFNLLVLVLLTDVAFRFTVASMLPRISYMTTWDVYYLGRFITIAAQAFAIVFLAWISKKTPYRDWETVDTRIFYTSAASSILIHLWLVFKLTESRRGAKRFLARQGTQIITEERVKMRKGSFVSEPTGVFSTLSKVNP